MSGFKCHCGTSLRRQRVRDSDVDMGDGLLLNGVDFVEVLDNTAPPGMAQKLVDLTFLKPDGLAGLGPQNFAITGGVRINGIVVLSVTLQPDGRTLQLALDQAGDFSPYTLSVNVSPLDNIDPQLSRVTFSFKVECPSNFDCADEISSSPARRQGPPTDYLTRDWAGFRSLMLDRMSATMPDWTERNPADLGVSIVEVLADAADKTSWFQDAIGTEAFFEKARFRQSLVRHSRLLGYRPGEGQNARTAVAITADLDRAGPAPIIAIGTRFLTPPADGPKPPAAVLPRDAELFEDLLARGAVVFEAMEPLASLKIKRNAIPLHDWGDEGCCLEPGATSVHLVGAPADLSLSKGDLLIFEELTPFGGTLDDPPDPTHRQIVRLSQDPIELDDPVFNLALTKVQWHAEDALCFAVPLGSVSDQPLAVARGNILLVDEGRTLDYSESGPAAGEDEIALSGNNRGLGPDDGPGQVLRYRLNASSVVRAVPFVPETARDASALSAMVPLGEAVAAVSLDGEGETWTTVPDLLASDGFAPHVAVEPGTAPGEAFVRFGDGVLGRAPTIGTRFTARIRSGGGLRGNIGSSAISYVVTSDGRGITAVDNPIPATGGKPPQSRAAIHVAAPQSFRTPRRAVTVEDYASVAARHPAVTRAYGLRRWTGSWHTITLAIDLVGGGKIDAAFEDDLRAFIEDHRLAGHDLKFVSPIFVALDIILYVCARPDAYPADINRDLLALFSDRDLANGTRGLFHPDILEFGKDVALSPLIARAMQVAGVSWIGTRNEQNTPVGQFARMDQPGIDYADDAILPIASAEIARLDNDPSRPENGRILFIVEGGR